VLFRKKRGNWLKNGKTPRSLGDFSPFSSDFLKNSILVYHFGNLGHFAGG